MWYFHECFFLRTSRVFPCGSISMNVSFVRTSRVFPCGISMNVSLWEPVGYSRVVFRKLHLHESMFLLLFASGVRRFEWLGDWSKSTGHQHRWVGHLHSWALDNIGLTEFCSSELEVNIEILYSLLTGRLCWYRHGEASLVHISELASWYHYVLIKWVGSKHRNCLLAVNHEFLHYVGQSINRVY